MASIDFTKVYNEHDFPEDFDMENGMYVCICRQCGVQFTGYKRRITCKSCEVSNMEKSAEAVKGE